MRHAAVLLGLALLFTSTARAAESNDTAKTAAAMTQAAQKFLASLDAETKAKVNLKFDDPARLDWHNIPKAERKGIAVTDMTQAQRELCHNLLRAALSESGYKQAIQIMSLETILRVFPTPGIDAALYGPERYFLAIFGEPARQGTWGWCFEGHHVSFNLVVRDGQVISDTPNFLGANPVVVHNPMPGSPPDGARTLEREEQTAFALVNVLDEVQRKKAIIAETSPRDYRSPGRPQPPQSAPEGLPASEMTEAQKQMLWAVLEAYCNNLTEELAAGRLAHVKANGLDRVYFAWAGGREQGVPHYYRVQGPTFLLEFANAQTGAGGNPANHIHSVWRNMKGDFGLPIQ